MFTIPVNKFNTKQDDNKLREFRCHTKKVSEQFSFLGIITEYYQVEVKEIILAWSLTFDLYCIKVWKTTLVYCLL